LSVVMGSFLGSRLTGSLGARRTMALGLLGICGATLVISGISAEGGLPYVLSNAVLAGLSLGCSAVASTTRGTAAVEGEERGLASGVLNSSAQIGTALGLAALITVAAARTGAIAGGEEASAAAVVEGFRAAFYVATGLAVAGALVPLLLMRGKEQAPLEKGGV
jgi:MFS family permease